MQLTLNILVAWCFVGLAAAGIGLVQSATRQVPLALAAVISLGIHLCHAFHEAGWPMWLATVASLLCASVSSVALDIGLRRCAAVGGQNDWTSLAVALGIYVVVQAGLSLVFGEAGRIFIITRSTLRIGEAWITSSQVCSLAITAAILSALLVMIRYTISGLAIRGLGSNSDLCGIYGIDIWEVRALAVGIGGVIATLSGILLAIDSGLIPGTGFTAFLAGLTAAIIGGVGSIYGVALAAFVVVFSRHLVAYLGDPQWMDAATFFVLIIFLLLRPFGISGRRLRKVRI